MVLFNKANLTAYGQVAQSLYRGLPACAGDLDSVTMIVLDWEGSVSGVQFDRYGALWLGGVELLRTTTPEPDGPSGIQWRIEKDLSQYRPLFARKSMNASLSIPNTVTPVYSGIEQITVTLSFCRGHRADHSPVPANVVQPLGDPTAGVASGVSPWTVMGLSGNQTRQMQIALPVPNANRAVIDVMASGHQCEEFWYTNVPNPNPNSGTCGGGSYREIRLFVDGMLAGSTIPFPVVYTGGINPLLWRPLTGISSFDIPAYRFDVTPFLGLLNDGAVHNVSVSVVNNNKGGVWYIDPVLLLWTDNNHQRLRGGIMHHRADDVSVHTHTTNISRSEVLYETIARPHGVFVEGELVAPDGTKQISSLNSLLQSRNSNRLVGADKQVTIATMESEATVHTKHYTQHGMLDGHTVQFSRSLAPISVYLDSRQDNSSFEIDATVQIERRRMEHTQIVKRSTSVSLPSCGDGEILWWNRINASAVYNRSLSNHSLVHKMRGASREEFAIEDTSKGVCFNHTMAAFGGRVTDDIVKDSYRCKFAFCGQELCGASTSSDVADVVPVMAAATDVQCDVVYMDTNLPKAHSVPSLPATMRMRGE